ncbi:MAG: hypothetical protein WCB04_10255, partial [Mycobacteriales bacterium]
MTLVIGAARLYAARLSPFALLLGPLVAAGLMLQRNFMRRLVALVLAVIIIDAWFNRLALLDVPSLIVIALVGAVGYAAAARRDRLGISAMRSEAMLVELRDRLRAQGEI